jgi:hypothetical protein
MPGFTFEKISPPAHRGPTTTAPRKPRGLISQMINRFAERRAKRSLRRQRDADRRDEKSSG